MLITKKQLLEQLAGQVSEAERAALEDGGRELVISRYNRATVLKLLSMKESGADYGAITVDTALVDGFKRELVEYLNRYMREQPEGHKWIILSCLFLTFIVREPMHPQEIVGWERLGGLYQCPSREMQAGSLCRWCVCGRNGTGETGPTAEQNGN